MGKQGRGAKRRHKRFQELVKFGVKKKGKMADVAVDVFVYLVGTFLVVDDIVVLAVVSPAFHALITDNLAVIQAYMNTHGRMCLALTQKNVPCSLARRSNSLYCHHHQRYVHRDIYVIDKVLRWEQRDDGWYGQVRWKGFVLGCTWEKFEQEANGKWRVCE